MPELRDERVARHGEFGGPVRRLDCSSDDEEYSSILRLCQASSDKLTV